jgi:hypothetical protein
MIISMKSYCILCGRRINEGDQKCAECEELADIIDVLYDDAKKELSHNPSVDREVVFKMLREFAFIVQEDSLLRTYRNSMKFFLDQFIDKKNDETTLDLFTKKVQTKLNQLKILKELSESSIINWDSSLLSNSTSPKIYPGDVTKNLKESYERSSVTDRAEQRYGHIIGFYSLLPLIKGYSRCESKEEIKKLNLVPKKPWIIMLSILVGNKDGRISIERTNKFLKKMRGIGNVSGAILSNLSSLNTDFVQRATVEIENDGDTDKVYVLSTDIVEYLQRLRELVRTR